MSFIVDRRKCNIHVLQKINLPFSKISKLNKYNQMHFNLKTSLDEFPTQRLVKWVYCATHTN